jgi:hypothetical protein
LNKQQDSLDIGNLKEAIILSRRIKGVKKLLSNHYYIVPIFQFLESKTIPDIYFNDMTLTEDGDYINMEFKGHAKDFSNLIVQKNWYAGDKKGNPNIEDFAFTNITRLKEKSGVEFDMSFRVPKLYLEKKKLTTIKK